MWPTLKIKNGNTEHNVNYFSKKKQESPAWKMVTKKKTLLVGFAEKINSTNESLSTSCK